MNAPPRHAPARPAWLRGARRAAAAAAAVAVAALTLGPAAAREERLETDLLIVGATESGWAAAIQAARMGVPSITIVHDGAWFGGQFTEQALACVDENKGVGTAGWGVDWHPMKRSFHRSGLFKELMDRIEAFNAETYGDPMPGRPFHGPSTFRPAEAEAIFRAMIQPQVDSGQVRVVWRRYPVAAGVDPSKDGNPRLRSLTFAPIDLQTGRSGAPDLTVFASLTIDASDWGDAIRASGAAYECGPDPRSRYGEPSAPGDGEIVPNEMNPITWTMIVAQSDGDTPIAEPEGFDDRRYIRATALSRIGREGLRWDRPVRLGGIPPWPPGGAARTSPRQLTILTVRRLVDGHTSRDGRTSSLLCYSNAQDYPLERLPGRVAGALEATEPGASRKNLVEMTREQRQCLFDDAKRHSLGLLYHLQQTVHDRSDDRVNSLRGFHLSGEFGTPDRLPPKPYIREGLRLRALYMMREQDARNRDGETKEQATERFAEVAYPDGLFAWQFHYDFHHTGRAYLEGQVGTGPWVDFEKPNRHTRFISDRALFPLRSLIPEAMDGLLGAQGNVGFSSIVSAAIRLHDQRIHLGQSAGAVAAVCLREGEDARRLVHDRLLLEQVRDGLCSEGMEGVPLLLWPFRDLKPGDEGFVAANRLAAAGLLPVAEGEVDFGADRPADGAWVAGVREAARNATGLEPQRPGTGATRGAVAASLWRECRLKRGDWRPWPARQPGDADGDGIPDRDDALLFTPNRPVVWEIRSSRLDQEKDGLAPASLGRDDRRFDFAGRGVALSSGFERDSGGVFAEERGFGWTRDLSGKARLRRALPETYRDTFLFTRDEDVWECAVGKGRYRVTVCVGDAGSAQTGHVVRVEGRMVVDHEATEAGRFHEATAEVEVSDGRLTIAIGRPGGGSNTCLNWLAFARVR